MQRQQGQDRQQDIAGGELPGAALPAGKYPRLVETNDNDKWKTLQFIQAEDALTAIYGRCRRQSRGAIDVAEDRLI